METVQLENLFYLVALLALVLGWFLAENRAGLGRTARGFLAWGLIFAATIAAYALWGDIRRELMPRQAYVDGGTIEVGLDASGHYQLVAEVNGVPVRFLVDTGASDIVLSRRDAARVGLPEDLTFFQTARTANGIARTAPARVDTLAVGDVVFRDVDVSVIEGELDRSLLGMAWLGRFGRLEIANGRLRLEL